MTSVRRKYESEDSVLEFESSPKIDTESKLRVFKLLGKSGYVQERRYPRIIRFRRFHEKEDAANYFREQIMLYHPWREEQTELINIDVVSVYKNLRGTIERIRIQFESMNLEINVEEILD
jgi:hypothetical protein